MFGVKWQINAGGEQGLQEQANKGCISEALDSGVSVSWVDTIEQRNGNGLLTVAAFDGVGCNGVRTKCFTISEVWGSIF